MARLKNGIFDVAPVPQGSIVNKISTAIQLFGFFVFTTLLILLIFMEMPKFVPKNILMIPTALFCCISLFGFYEGQVESERIKGVASEIQSSPPAKKQFVQGTHSNEPVWFSIATMPTSINYAIKVNGQKALEQKTRLEQYITSELAAEGIRGFRILITEDSVILTKLLMIAFQIVPEKTAPIYSTLVRAKRDLLN